MSAQLVPTLIVGAIVVIALVGMAVSWRARKKRQRGLDGAHSVPSSLQPATVSEELLYVSTTLADDPLERVAVAGLGARGKATVGVHPEGVVLDIRGADPVFIPADDIVTASVGTVTIDRVVERDGLAVITWLLAGTPVTSFLRPASAPQKRQIIAAVSDIARGSITSNTVPPERNNPRGNS